MHSMTNYFIISSSLNLNLLLNWFSFFAENTSLESTYPILCFRHLTVVLYFNLIVSLLIFCSWSILLTSLSWDTCGPKLWRILRKLLINLWEMGKDLQLLLVIAVNILSHYLLKDAQVHGLAVIMTQFSPIYSSISTYEYLT